MQGIVETWGLIQGWWWHGDATTLSYPMILLGAALLLAAGFLIGFRRKTRVSVESSPLSHELMAYLGRIADAIERLQAPSTDEIAGNVLRRLQEIANTKPDGKMQQISNSMFGREYRRDE